MRLRGTVLTLIGPDKLSDMTDTITAGIAPDTEKFEEITSSILENMSANMESIMGSITAGISDEAKLQEKMAEIMMSPDIPEEDKAEMQAVFAGAEHDSEQSDMQAKFLSLPDSILNVFFDGITVNGVTIPTADQVAMMKLFGSLDMEDEAAMQEAMADIPESVSNAMYTDLQFTLDTVLLKP